MRHPPAFGVIVLSLLWHAALPARAGGATDSSALITEALDQPVVL